MDPTTLRLPSDLLEQIDERVDDEGFSSRSEYIRIVLQSHLDTGPNTDPNTISELTDRMDEFDRRLDRLDTHNDLDRNRLPSREIRHTTEDTDGGDEDDTGISAALDGWRPGRSATKREEQREAGREVLRWMREQEVASASEFKENVEPDHSVTGQSAQTWWKKTAREVLKRAQDEDLVEYIDGRGEWIWRE